MKVTIITYGWTAGHFSEYFLDELWELSGILEKRGHQLHVVLGFGKGEADERDTEELYEKVGFHFPVSFIDVHHDGPRFGSVVNGQRFKQLAGVGDKLLSAVPPDTDILGLVESDLHFEAPVLDKLIRGVNQNNAMMAPMVKGIQNEESFYDTWAFVCNGRNFRGQSPYHYMLRKVDRYLPMDSIGSCFFVKWGWVKDIKFPPKDVVIGYCRQVRELGHTILLDKEQEVFHP